MRLLDIIASYHARHMSAAERALARNDLPRFWLEARMCDCAAGCTDICPPSETLSLDTMSEESDVPAAKLE